MSDNVGWGTKAHNAEATETQGGGDAPPRDFSVRNERRYRWVSGATADIFVLMSEEYFTYPGSRTSRSLLPVGRLQPSVSYEEAAAALFLGRFLQVVTFGISPTEPLTLGAMAVTLAVVSVLACLAPARWACRVDPVRALRGVSH